MNALQFQKKLLSMQEILRLCLQRIGMMPKI